MFRREFVRLIPAGVLGFLGLRLAGCGKDPAGAGLRDKSIGQTLESLPPTLKIWSYYVPLTSYSGVIEDFDGRNPLDRKIIIEAARRQTARISGRRNDGTENPAVLNIEELRNCGEFLRLKFWHDDSGTGTAGHSLFLFKRYLTSLEAGEKVFVATGMVQGHFHVVMIDPAG